MSFSGRVLLWTPILFHQNLESHFIAGEERVDRVHEIFKDLLHLPMGQAEFKPTASTTQLFGWLVCAGRPECWRLPTGGQYGTNRVSAIFFWNRFFVKKEVSVVHVGSMLFLTKVVSWTSNGIGTNWSDFERYPLLELQVCWNDGWFVSARWCLDIWIKRLCLMNPSLPSFLWKLSNRNRTKERKGAFQSCRDLGWAGSQEITQ